MAKEKAKIPFMLSLLPYACFIAGGYLAHRKNSGLGKIFLYGLGGFAVGVIPVIIYMRSNRAKMIEKFRKRHETQPTPTATDIEVGKLTTDDKLQQIVIYAQKYEMLKDDVQEKAFRNWAKEKLGDNEINLMVKFAKFIDENQTLDMKDAKKVDETYKKYGVDWNNEKIKYSANKILKSEFGYLFGA